MTTTEHTELIRRLADDFTALQEAVLARMNGICAPETAAALEHASLTGPVTVVLAHADAWSTRPCTPPTRRPPTGPSSSRRAGS